MHCAHHGNWRRPRLHADQRHSGSLLERSHQRCRRGAADDHHDVDGAQTRVMGQQTIGLTLKIFGWIATVFMALAAIAMIVMNVNPS